jgi:EmrB/QacA subfamily drug resistance transporter
MPQSTIEGRQDSRRWLALAVIVAAQFMVILDVAIVNVALPSIKTELHFSEESLQWVITAYAILFGGALLLGGRLADVFGRRRLFIAGVGLFSLSSLLSGLAWSAGSLIVFRGLQGLGGALLAPAALSILMTTFREGRDRNIALGIWGAASGSGGAAGVLLGGVLTSYVHWSWIFFINVPVGAALIAVAPTLLQESRALLAHRRFDVAGAASVTSGLMLFVYSLTRAAQHGWSDSWTIALLAVSAGLIAAFVAIERRSAAPLLPLRIFRQRTLAAANATGVVIAAVGFSMFFLLALYLQQVLRYSAIQTGVAFVAITLTIVAFSNVAQTLVTRLGVRRVLVAGLVLDTAALAWLSRMPLDGHYFSDIFPALLVAGVGMALSFVPMTIAGLTGVHPADAGIASGLINTSRQMGGAIGLAAVSTIAASVSGPNPTASALTHGFQVAFYALTGLAVVGIVIAAVFVEREPQLAEVQPLGVEAIATLEEAA